MLMKIVPKIFPGRETQRKPLRESEYIIPFFDRLVNDR